MEFIKVKDRNNLIYIINLSDVSSFYGANKNKTIICFICERESLHIDININVLEEKIKQVFGDNSILEI